MMLTNGLQQTHIRVHISVQKCNRKILWPLDWIKTHCADNNEMEIRCHDAPSYVTDIPTQALNNLCSRLAVDSINVYWFLY